MPGFDNYTELLERDPHERLAWMAHSVQTPFTDMYRRTDCDAYDLATRDIGEMIAAQVVLYGEPEPLGEDLIKKLRMIASNRTDTLGTRFLEDETALAHAAEVVKVCVANFDNWQEYLING